jgi:hypothetical protein
VSEPDPQRAARPEEAWLDEHLGMYLRDSSLWPVAIAGFSIAVTLGAALLAASVLTRNPLLWGAVGILALLSLDVLQRELRSRRRLGVASRALLLLWLTSAAAAALARYFGWI